MCWHVCCGIKELLVLCYYKSSQQFIKLTINHFVGLAFLPQWGYFLSKIAFAIAISDFLVLGMGTLPH